MNGRLYTARGQGAPITIGGRADNVVSPFPSETARRVGVDRSACGVAASVSMQQMRLHLLIYL